MQRRPIDPQQFAQRGRVAAVGFALLAFFRLDQDHLVTAVVPQQADHSHLDLDSMSFQRHLEAVTGDRRPWTQTKIFFRHHYDAGEFVETCTLWALQKDGTLSDLLVERNLMTATDVLHVDYLLERRLERHDRSAKYEQTGSRNLPRTPLT